MSENHADIPWLTREFFENQDKIQPEDMIQYAGQYLAWSWDGSQVVASAPTREELEEKLKSMGVNLQRVAWDYQPPLGTSLLL